eukprot:7091808-Prymnesium_polylepis.1
MTNSRMSEASEGVAPSSVSISTVSRAPLIGSTLRQLVPACTHRRCSSQAWGHAGVDREEGRAGAWGAPASRKPPLRRARSGAA